MVNSLDLLKVDKKGFNVIYHLCRWNPDIQILKPLYELNLIDFNRKVTVDGYTFRSIHSCLSYCNYDLIIWLINIQVIKLDEIIDDEGIVRQGSALGSKSKKAFFMVVALVATTAACGNNETSQTRNATLVAGTACKKPGQVTKVSKVSVVCAKTPASKIWYATISAKGKSVACSTPGNVRKKKAVVWICGLAQGKKQWRATAPLPPKVIEASSNSIPVFPILIPTLESTDVATPAQPVVADNGVLADPTIIDLTPEPTTSTPKTFYFFTRHGPT
jgi:hypothetical protein